MMAAMASRDRQAALRSGTADLRQRLEAAQAELQRQRAENDRLAAALAAAYKAADAATVMAQDNLAVINAQIKALNAGAGTSTWRGLSGPPNWYPLSGWTCVPAMPR